MPASSLNTSYSPDKLVSGPTIRHAKKRTLLSGEGALVRGTVLGKVTVGAAASAPFAGNTGNGVMGAVTTGANSKPGIYNVLIIEPGANVGTFLVEDPDGNIVGRGTVAVAFAGPINFTLADGATDFISGDGFQITVAAGTGKFRKAVAANVDGSQRPLEILLEDADSTAADVECETWTTGDFNPAALTFGAGVTAANSEDALRLLGIFFVTVQA
jgi:Bacteriophage lambda head decoration protein D